MVTRITEVFQLQLPVEVTPLHDSPCGPMVRKYPTEALALTTESQVQQLLQMLDVININISALGLPLQCFGLRGFEDHLTVMIIASRHVEKSLPQSSLATVSRRWWSTQS